MSIKLFSLTKNSFFPSYEVSSCTPVVVKFLTECKTMLTYTIENGIKIPDWIGKDFTDISSKVTIDLKTLNNSTGKEKDSLEIKIAELVKDDSSKLSVIHAALVELVKPATPLTIRYTTPRTRFITGEAVTIPLIRNMWVLSILFLIGFIFSLYLYDNALVVKPNAAQTQNLKLYLSFHLLFAAGLGAYFFSLYTANRYYVTRTFDPKYLTFYNNRIIIGIIAGFILANILDANKLAMSNNMFAKFTPSIIAILGGYSADAVNKILARIVAMLITLVQGETKDIIDAKENEWKNRNEASEIKNKLNSASDILTLLNENKDKLDATTNQKFMDLLNNWLKPKP